MPPLIATWNPARGVWETTTGSLLCGHLEPFSQTWPTSGMTRRGVAYELPTSVPLTADTASSSSPGLLPTPTTADGKGGPGNSGRDGGENLRTVAAALLPTPSVADALGGHRMRSGSRSGELLLPGVAQQITAWRGAPTPLPSTGGNAHLDV